MKDAAIVPVLRSRHSFGIQHPDPDGFIFRIGQFQVIDDPQVDHDSTGIAFQGFLQLDLGKGAQRKKQGQPKADPAIC